MAAFDRPGVLAMVTRILGDRDISIEAIVQKEPDEEAKYVPIIILTQPVQERNMNEAIAMIEKLDAIKGRVNRIRVETLD